MGACTTHTSRSDQNDDFRILRQGNLTFYIYGIFYSETLTTGEGIKRTPAWHTDLSEAEISQKVNEFWETRVDGSPNIWLTIRKIIEEPSQKACKTYLKQSGLTLVNGNLLQVFDDRGHRYDVPIYVINKPVKYEQRKLEKKVEQEQRKETDLTITLRMAGKDDWKSAVKTTTQVKSLKQSFREALKIEKNIRLFFNGKELKDSEELGSFKLREGCVLIAY